jgi:hypothetical protein
MARSSGPEHTSAVRRLSGARDERNRLRSLSAAAAGTRAEPLAQRQLSAARAEVASRAQWLHWIDEGQSLAPWEDGVWAPQTPMAAPEPRAVAGIPLSSMLGPDPEPLGMRFAVLAERLRRA